MTREQSLTSVNTNYVGQEYFGKKKRREGKSVLGCEITKKIFVFAAPALLCHLVSTAYQNLSLIFFFEAEKENEFTRSLRWLRRCQ